MYLKSPGDCHRGLTLTFKLREVLPSFSLNLILDAKSSSVVHLSFFSLHPTNPAGFEPASPQMRCSAAELRIHNPACLEVVNRVTCLVGSRTLQVGGISASLPITYERRGATHRANGRVSFMAFTIIEEPPATHHSALSVYPFHHKHTMSFRSSSGLTRSYNATRGAMH